MRLRVLRAAAKAVDLLLAAALALALSQTRVGEFFANRAVVMLHIGSAGTVWKGPIPMIMGYLGTFVYTLPFACLIVALIEPASGVSPGKLLFRLRVIGSDDPTIARRERWRRAMIEATPLGGLVIALLTGSWQLAIVAVAAGLLLVARSIVWLFLPAR